MLLQLIKCCRAGKGFVPDIDPGAAFVSAAKKHLLRREEPDFPVIENGYPDELSYGVSWYWISRSFSMQKNIFY